MMMAITKRRLFILFFLWTLALYVKATFATKPNANSTFVNDVTASPALSALKRLHHLAKSFSVSF
jgi:hypothetical protein